MSISNGNLFISHRQGISKIDLETCQFRLVVALDDQPCVLTSFGTEILYTNQKKASVWQLNGDGGDLRLFARSENEDGTVMVQSKQAALSSQWASVQSLAALCTFATPRQIQSRSV